MGSMDYYVCEMCDTPLGVFPVRVQYQAVDRTIHLCREHAEPIRQIVRATRTRQMEYRVDRMSPAEAARTSAAVRGMKQGTIRALRRGGTR